MPLVCSSCSKETEALTKQGICAVCNESGKAVSKGASASWGNERYARLFCGMWGDKLVWDSAMRIYWRYLTADGRKPKDGEYRGCVWVPYYVDRMERDVFRCIQSAERGKHITDGVVADVVKLCRFLANNEKDVDGMDDRYISFNDTLIDPDTLEKKPHHPSNVATTHFPINFDEISEVKCPWWDKYLDVTCRDFDGNPVPEMRDQIYEAIGYLISNKNKHNAFFLTGCGGNGKGVMLNVIEAIIGRHRTSKLTIPQMEGFNLSSTFGRKVNIDFDDECDGINPAVFRKMVSNEPFMVRELYEPAREIRRWPKFVGAFNHFPQFKSFGDAMLRRCVIISFGYKVKKEELIDDLHGKIVNGGELPAIVYRSLQAIERLNRNNFTFTTTNDSLEALSMMEDASSSVASYLKKTWIKDDGGKVPFSDVYDEYCAWTITNRHKAVSSTRFARDALELIGKSKAMNRIGLNDGKNFMGYRISRKPEVEVEVSRSGQCDDISSVFSGEPEF